MITKVKSPAAVTTQNATCAPLLSMTQPEIAEAKAIPKPAPVLAQAKPSVNQFWGTSCPISV